MAFFYCKHKDADRDNFLAVAKGILSQLLTQNPQLIQHFYEKSSECGETSLRTRLLAGELLQVALSSAQRIYVVLDGLDECDAKERRDVAKFFRNAVESLTATDMDSIRCLFVSQDDGVAKKHLVNVPMVAVRPSDTKHDIQSFVSVWKDKIENKHGSLQGTGCDLVKIVTARAHGTSFTWAADPNSEYELLKEKLTWYTGMFLFFKLVVMENLYEQTSTENLITELENFPTGLDQAYVHDIV